MNIREVLPPIRIVANIPYRALVTTLRNKRSEMEGFVKFFNRTIKSIRDQNELFFFITPIKLSIIQ